MFDKLGVFARATCRFKGGQAQHVNLSTCARFSSCIELNCVQAVRLFIKDLPGFVEFIFVLFVLMQLMGLSGLILLIGLPELITFYVWSVNSVSPVKWGKLG